MITLTFDEVENSEYFSDENRESTEKFIKNSFSAFMLNDYSLHLGLGTIYTNHNLLFERVIVDDLYEPLAMIIYSIIPGIAISILCSAMYGDCNIAKVLPKIEEEVYSYGLPVYYYADSMEERDYVLSNAKNIRVAFIKR